MILLINSIKEHRVHEELVHSSIQEVCLNIYLKPFFFMISEIVFNLYIILYISIYIVYILFIEFKC